VRRAVRAISTAFDQYVYRSRAIPAHPAVGRKHLAGAVENRGPAETPWGRQTSGQTGQTRLFCLACCDCCTRPPRGCHQAAIGHVVPTSPPHQWSSSGGGNHGGREYPMAGHRRAKRAAAPRVVTEERACPDTAPLGTAEGRSRPRLARGDIVNLIMGDEETRALPMPPWGPPAGHQCRCR
jgi:hypothetical protein